MLCYFCVFCVFCLLSVLVRLSVPMQVIDWKDSSLKWPICVDGDVKPYSLSHSLTHSLTHSQFLIKQCMQLKCCFKYKSQQSSFEVYTGMVSQWCVWNPRNWSHKRRRICIGYLSRWRYNNKSACLCQTFREVGCMRARNSVRSCWSWYAG